MGYIKTDVSGEYTFKVAHDNGATLSINGAEIINDLSSDKFRDSNEGKKFLEKGIEYPIFLTYDTKERSGENVGIQLLWKKPGATNFEIVGSNNLFH